MYKIGGKYLSKLIGALCWIALLSCGAEKEQAEDPSITEFNDPVIKGISMALAKEPRNADLYFERAAQWVDRGAYDAAIDKFPIKW